MTIQSVPHPLSVMKLWVKILSLRVGRFNKLKNNSSFSRSVFSKIALCGENEPLCLPYTIYHKPLFIESNVCSLPVETQSIFILGI